MRVYANAEAKSVAVDPSRFSGLVWRTDTIDASAGGGLSGLRFNYAPGARSHWHVHTEEQALVVLDGRGWVAWEGGPGPQALAPGDWVHVTAGVAHWHGADPSSVFSHLAITCGGEVHWLGPVED
jgi:quercetin dioxygenase-like cupin family protein